MSENAEIELFIISDSSGETALNVAQTAVSQFPDLTVKYQRFPFIQTESILSGILNLAAKKQAVVYYTLVTHSLSDQVHDFTTEHNLQSFDCLQPAIKALATRSGQEPASIPSMNHSLTDTYFDRIGAMEFAVAYDDGKDPTGLLKADLVILGVSRTSKTPLSLFLANRGIKVANLPLSPTSQLPDEIWQVNPKKIIGLTNSPKVLRRIRQQRMISYGLPAESAYSDTEKIKAELKYADDIYQKIGCLVINVANKSIEETSTLILESLDLEPAEVDTIKD